MTLAPDANLKLVGLKTSRCVLGVTCNKPMSAIPQPLEPWAHFNLRSWYIDSAFAVSAETDAWPHEFQTSNGSVNGQIIGLILTWNSVSSTTSETLSRHVNFGKENLTHIWYAVLWPQLLVYLMICGKTLTNIVSYQYCIHYRYRLVFIICMCPPFKYTLPWTVLCFTCLVCVCLNR